MKKPKKPRKPRTHITLAGPILRAAEALAQIEDITLSELIEDLMRDHLAEHGCLPTITAEQIEQEMDRIATERAKQQKNK